VPAGVRRRLRGSLTLAALVAAAAGIAGIALMPEATVVTVVGADHRPVASRPLPASGQFELRYRHSYYQAEAAESFVARPGGGFTLVAVRSPSQAVLDYYGLAGRTSRKGRWLRLELREPQHFQQLPLIATRLGQRTLVVASEPVPLARGDGDPTHLTIIVQRRPWALTVSWLPLGRDRPGGVPSVTACS
jgi:hypothetical protein